MVLMNIISTRGDNEHLYKTRDKTECHCITTYYTISSAKKYI